MGSQQSREIDTERPSQFPDNIDPRSPCPEITRTPLQVVVDKDDPRSPSTNVLRTPIDKSSEQTPEVTSENRGERCPLLKHSSQVEKKCLLKEFNN